MPQLGRQAVRDWFTSVLARHPFVALPVPGGPAGLSASLQLVGSPGTEEQLLDLGRIVEAAITAG